MKKATIPATSRGTHKTRKPDFMKQLREIYGDFVMPEADAKAILVENKGKW